jgi:3-oxo-5alpha-steroid 4-dehydrogenase
MASRLCRGLLLNLERAFGTVTRVRARGGVIISAGGFIYNRSMMEKHAPRYAGCMPLGTPGDDGSGIMLGLSAGGSLSSMDACAASRFFAPPEAFVSGLLMNIQGERFCDESLYGATLSRHISEQPERRAYLVIDETIMTRAKEQMLREERLRDFSLSRILSGEMNALIFRKAMFFVNSRLNRMKAASLAELETKCSIPAGSLSGAVARHNKDLASGKRDEYGKPDHYRETICRPPFYAINCRLDSRIFPSPCITLGGLAVNAVTGQVTRGDGTFIPGLYAAGRSAAGICSRSYVSGLSLGDCIFSGRNAGRHAAAAAAQSLKIKKGVSHGSA